MRREVVGSRCAATATAQQLHATLVARGVRAWFGGTGDIDEWLYATDPDGHVLELTW